MQLIYTIHIIISTTEFGTLLQRMQYNAWGKRELLVSNTGNNAFLFDRGYTGHEHLDVFKLINMNGRLYDPVLGRMLSPDNFAQSSTQGLNRYSYAMNNPLVYTDPTGEKWWHWLGLELLSGGALSIQAATAATTMATTVGTTALTSSTGGFAQRFTSTGHNRWNAAWNQSKLSFSNDVKIWGGLLATNPNRSFAGQTFEVGSRLTWQLPQTTIGLFYNQFKNTVIGDVEDVEYFHGATYVVGATHNEAAVTFGPYISISPVSEDEQANIEISQFGYSTMHEYGHYIESQESGPLYLFKYGIPSASGAEWTEYDANTRAANYFHKIDPSFTWVQTPSIYRTLTSRVYNPRWFEYPMFLIPTLLIIAKNWRSPW